MSDKSILEKIAEKRFSYKSRATASVAVCLLGVASMHFSGGETGVGWAILGLMFIWG